HLQRDIAVKVLDPELADNEVARRRFCREARAAAAVTHDNLVAVHQVDEETASNLPYLVMQLVIGESLEQRLKRVGKLPPLEVARLGQQAAAGLAAAHADRLLAKDPAERFQSATEVAEIFATELARIGIEVPSGGCGRTSAYALRSRRQICWKTVAFKTLPLVAAAILGGLVVGLWPADPPASILPGANGGSAAPAATDPSVPPEEIIPGKNGPVWSLAFT